MPNKLSTRSTKKSLLEQLVELLNEAQVYVGTFEDKEGHMSYYIIGHDGEQANFIDRGIVEKGKTRKDDIWAWVIGKEVEDQKNKSHHQCNNCR